MFECQVHGNLPGCTPEGSSALLTDAPSLDELRNALTRLAGVSGDGLDEGCLIDHLAALEALKSAIAAAQVRVTTALAASRARSEAARGIAAERRCQGLAAEIALAKRQSPYRGARDLGMAKALSYEMPETLGALTRGEIPEFRAMLVVSETAVLSREHRTQVDAELGKRLADLGDRSAAAETRKIGYRLDPGSALRRTRGAASDRYVSLRPAPDTMSYLTGFLPVAQGVACKAALMRHADSLRAEGDERSRGQIMADALVERITGQASADAVTLEVSLVMTDRALLGNDNAPAHAENYGPVPASLARQIVRDADRVWLRRLFLAPDATSLVAMDSRSRGFDGELRRFVVVRDQNCRSPWCDAPVRHADHVVRVADGGATTAENGQGLCERCNYAKEAAGWATKQIQGRRHRVEITTPTGHRYVSEAPDPPGVDPPLRRLDNLFRDFPDPVAEQLRRLAAA
ncbi:MAG: nuclease [Marmoricola sp.]|nr:nuclease [Marmoricola sp.]